MGFWILFGICLFLVHRLDSHIINVNAIRRIREAGKTPDTPAPFTVKKEKACLNS